MNAIAPIIEADDRIDHRLAFLARAAARLFLVNAGEFDLGEAVDGRSSRHRQDPRSPRQPNVELDPSNIKILAADLLEIGGIGNLASPEIQSELDQWIEDIDLLVLDNLSSLTAVLRDNDAESWGPIQDWLLRLRRRGISVLIVHHAGKGGTQRGTSRREDVLDTSISLCRPADYSPAEGARFEVHLEKARGVHGDGARPFEAKLEVRGDAAIWTMLEIEDVNRARVAALLNDGLSLRDIADETGISKSTVQRIKKAIDLAAGGSNDD